MIFFLRYVEIERKKIEEEKYAEMMKRNKSDRNKLIVYYYLCVFNV